MSMKTNGFWSTAVLVVLAAGLSAQTPAPAAQPPAATQEKPTFRVQVDLVSNDIIVRDDKGNFVPDLKKEEFEVWEDGVKQDVVQMTVVTRPPVTTVICTTSCFTPSSQTSNSSFFRSGTKFPLSSRTMMSFETRSTCTRKVGFSCVAAGGWAAGAGVWAESPAARTTRTAVDQNPFVFILISSNYTS